MPTWLKEVKEGYVDDPQCTRLLVAAAVQAIVESSFTVQDGLIRYKGRIWIGQNKGVQQRLLTEFHSGALGGHSGVQATYSRLTKLFCMASIETDCEAIFESV